MNYQSRKAKVEKNISVFTLNLRFGLADDGPNSWEFRKKSFPGLLHKFLSDFMAFQEVNDFQGNFLKGLLVGYHNIGKRNPAPRFWQNNLIFYKKSWQCLKWEHFFLSPTPDVPSRSPQSKWPRQCTIGLFKRKSISIILINTHFDFDEQIQIESAQYIIERLLSFPSDVPAILVGDFNCLPSQSCHKVFTGEDQDLVVKKGRVFKPVFHKPYQGTHHGFSGNAGENQIDWIMYSGDIKPVKWGVVQSKFAGIYPSDHFPLYAVFE
ncbi:MAG: endonuclease/exonuclease/phosphatase family protein [Desulfobacterales bacterium]